MPEDLAVSTSLEMSVDRSRCCGYAICVGMCPEVFELDDDGLARTGPGPIPVELHVAAKRAAGSCPEAAITVVERTETRAPTN